ncbi:MAG: hypothetical protein K2X39_08360, partial [Silvanigrellaceae bacterium]|nr:hypothetical protein [Silvanigrellaceae bacterium]
QALQDFKQSHDDYKNNASGPKEISYYHSIYKQHYLPQLTVINEIFANLTKSYKVYRLIIEVENLVLNKEAHNATSDSGLILLLMQKLDDPNVLTTLQDRVNTRKAALSVALQPIEAQLLDFIQILQTRKCHFEQLGGKENSETAQTIHQFIEKITDEMKDFKKLKLSKEQFKKDLNALRTHSALTTPRTSYGETLQRWGLMNTTSINKLDQLQAAISTLSTGPNT